MVIKSPLERFVSMIVVSLGMALGVAHFGLSAWIDREINRHQLNLDALITEHTPAKKGGASIRCSYELDGVRYTYSSFTMDPMAVLGARIPIEIDRTHPKRVRLPRDARLDPQLGIFIALFFLMFFLVMMKRAWAEFTQSSPREDPQAPVTRYEPGVRPQKREGDSGLFRKHHLQENHRELSALRTGSLLPIAKTLAHAQTRVVGRLRYLHQPLVAPLSKKPCAGYQLIVETSHDGEIRQVLCEAKAVDFLIEDETGVAFVRAAGSVSLALVKDVHQCSLSLTDLTPEMTQLFNRTQQLASVNPQAGDPLCFREGVLTEEELVLVVGEGRWEVDPSRDAHGYREPARRLLMVASPGQPLVISDDPAATAGDEAGANPQVGGPGRDGGSSA